MTQTPAPQPQARQYSPLAWGFGIGCGLILASLVLSAVMFGGCFALLLGGTAATVASVQEAQKATAPLPTPTRTAQPALATPIAPVQKPAPAPEPAPEAFPSSPAALTVTLLRIADNAATLQVNGPGDQFMSTTLTKGEPLVGGWTVDHVSRTAVYLKKAGEKKPLYIGLNSTVPLE